MSLRTLEEIAQDTILLLSLANGVGTQVYAEPRITLLVNLTFELLYKRRWWPQLMTWFSASLDGSLGVPVNESNSDGYSLADVKNYSDIRAVFRAGSGTPLSQLPDGINPYDIDSGELLYIDATKVADKPFSVWGREATATLSIHARIKPTRYVATDEVNFDDLALAYGAAWAYAEDDGTNPGATEKFQKLFVDRVKVIEDEIDDKPIQLDHRSVEIPSRWWVSAHG